MPSTEQSPPKTSAATGTIYPFLSFVASSLVRDRRIFKKNWIKMVGITVNPSVVDRHRFDADPDPIFHFDADPNPDPP